MASLDPPPWPLLSAALSAGDGAPPDSEYAPSLHLASSFGAVDGVTAALLRAPPRTLRQRDSESGYTPLHRALLGGNLGAALTLIAAGAVPDDGVVLPPRDHARAARGGWRGGSSLPKASLLDREGLTPVEAVAQGLSPALSQRRAALLTLASGAAPPAPAPPRNTRPPALCDEPSPCVALHVRAPQSPPPPAGVHTSVYSWGRAEFQLGVGAREGDLVSPRRVVCDGWAGGRGPAAVVSVVSGAAHNSALSEDGWVWVWGHASGGRLGLVDAPTTPRLLPTLLPLPPRLRVTAMALGERHSLFLSARGEVWACGDAGGGGAPSTTPRRVDNGSLRGLCITRIAAGAHHSLAADGDGLHAWGDDTHGQLGVAGSYSAQPARCSLPPPAGDGGGGISALAASDTYSLVARGTDVFQSAGRGGWSRCFFDAFSADNEDRVADALDAASVLREGGANGGGDRGAVKAWSDARGGDGAGGGATPRARPGFSGRGVGVG